MNNFGLQLRRNTILLFVEMGRRTSELTVRRSYAVDGRMHLEVPLSLSLSSAAAAEAKSDYGAFNCRKHLRSAAGEKERKREGYVMCAICYGLLPTFPLLSSDKGGRGKEGKEGEGEREGET